MIMHGHASVGHATHHPRRLADRPAHDFRYGAVLILFIAFAPP